MLVFKCEPFWLVMPSVSNNLLCLTYIRQSSGRSLVCTLKSHGHLKNPNIEVAGGIHFLNTKHGFYGIEALEDEKLLLCSGRGNSSGDRWWRWLHNVNELNVAEPCT